MKTLRVLLLILVPGLFSTVSNADVVVLVHGYLSGAETWDASGVTGALESGGWQRAGLLRAGPAAIESFPGPGLDAPRRYYTVDLPSEAPIEVQAALLDAMWPAISRQPGEALIVVGHSNGGVVARAALVRRQPEGLAALVTIASPHLGTARAAQALDVTDTPFPISVVTDFFGGDGYRALRRSGPLLSELLPATPGTFLYWLNNQPHPPIRYLSVVRGDAVAIDGDALVPGFSQDMNRVPAIAGRGETVRMPGTHALSYEDGVLLSGLLADIRSSPATAENTWQDRP